MSDMKRRGPVRWAVRWRSVSRLDGVTEHWCWDYCKPALFMTRREARAYIKQEYGYIAERPDLRGEPHGWRMPRAVKVRVILEEVVP